MDKLTYKLEVFEGPLDLLLHLISKNKLNICDIPVSELLEQYMAQIQRMRAYELEIASEFLEMAARLVYLKTISLLPNHRETEELKQALTGELLEYELCRRMAQQLKERSDGFDILTRQPAPVELDKTYRNRHDACVLQDAYLAAAGRGRRKLPPPAAAFERIVTRKAVSVSSKIVYVLRKLYRGGKRRLNALFQQAQSRSDMVATFLAVLELCRGGRVTISGALENAEIAMIKEKRQP